MEQIIELLKSLSAFNKLDERTVDIISNIFKIDALKICKDNGISYFIKGIDIM